MKPISREQMQQALVQQCQQPNQQSQPQDLQEIQRRADHLWDLMGGDVHGQMDPQEWSGRVIDMD